MPKIIVASRYLKPASKGTRSNLVKYIATRETVQKYSPKQKNISATENQKQLIFELLKINSDGKKLPEYSDYLKNPSKKNASELLSELLEQSADMIADKEILVKYVAESPGVEKIGKTGLFADNDDEIVLSQAQKNIAEHQGNVWSHVISLTREDAERLGYTTSEMWRSLIMRHADDIAKAQNIRLENLRWYAAFHNTAHHPHIHLLVYSTDIKEGFLTENGFEQIKSALANDIFHNELYQVYEKQTQTRDKLCSQAEFEMRRLLSELKNTDNFNPIFGELILKLLRQLKNSKCKKVYGYLQPNVKKTVDQIVTELAKNPVLKKMYDEWCSLEQQKYETYTSAVQKFPPLEENKVFKLIKNAVIRAVLEMDFVNEFQTERAGNSTRTQSTIFNILKLFGELISDDYNRNLRGQKLRTERKLRAAIRRKKQALGLKDNPLENPQFKEG
ncbi:MAG: relaxase MobL [Oscillospiraceae bacterium]|nr:relaxase MobL [Oscillospiraceae bacterium]